jgi:AraC-like DNA-binding protein
MIPARYYAQLRELVERAGMAASGDLLHLVTTDGRLGAHGGAGGELTCTYRHVEPGGRGEELCMQAGADPRLAGILRRPGAALPPPVTFAGAFGSALAQALRHGYPSLRTVASQLALSPRTLQRRLAEHGTTWRAELDTARRAIATGTAPAKMASLSRQLGYSDPRSARRALRRWASRPPHPAPHATWLDRQQTTAARWLPGSCRRRFAAPGGVPGTTPGRKPPGAAAGPPGSLPRLGARRRTSARS